MSYTGFIFRIRLQQYKKNYKMNATNQNQENFKFEEVQIPVPWGYIAGKWYGKKNIRPVVGIHGWLDNADTFDNLIPFLPSHISFFTIDLPGHGLSSRLPNGVGYHPIDYVYHLLLIMKEFNWEKISILAHSLGAIVTFIFSSLFPDKVEMYIAIDAMIPWVRMDLQESANRLEKCLLADERNQTDIEPPSYSYAELIERLYDGSFGSVEKENCPILLNRNITKSTKFPNKYYFSRDSRLKYYQYYATAQENALEMAKNIKAPTVYIMATGTKTPFSVEQNDYFQEVLDTLKQKTNFQYYEVFGSHHVHLNEPQKIIDIINPFICKYHIQKDINCKL